MPIIPGVMPIQNYASFRRLVKLTRCDVPARIMAELEPIKADDAAVKRYGAALATEMVRRLMQDGAVQGVHFCTLNLEKSVRVIMEDLGWSSSSASTSASAPVVQVPSKGSVVSDEPGADSGGQHVKVRRGSNRIIEGDNHQNHVDNLSVSPSEASQLAQYGLTHKQTVLPPTPKHGGQVSAHEDSWDEYPNGRFTDVRSPAYGEIDGWGSGLKSTVRIIHLSAYLSSFWHHSRYMRHTKTPKTALTYRPPPPSKNGAHPPPPPTSPTYSHPTSLPTRPTQSRHSATCPSRRNRRPSCPPCSRSTRQTSSTGRSDRSPPSMPSTAPTRCTAGVPRGVMCFKRPLSSFSCRGKRWSGSRGGWRRGRGSLQCMRVINRCVLRFRRFWNA